MAQTADKFLLRFPDGMHLKLKLAAAANKRSLNSEIVSRLEWALAEISMKELDDEIKLELIRKILVPKK